MDNVTDFRALSALNNVRSPLCGVEWRGVFGVAKEGYYTLVTWLVGQLARL
jgi:hypothetical protein